MWDERKTALENTADDYNRMARGTLTWIIIAIIIGVIVYLLK